MRRTSTPANKTSEAGLHKTPVMKPGDEPKDPDRSRSAKVLHLGARNGSVARRKTKGTNAQNQFGFVCLAGACALWPTLPPPFHHMRSALIRRCVTVYSHGCLRLA